MKKLFLLLLINLLSYTLIFAQKTEGLPIDDEERTEWHTLFNKKPEWYQTIEARRVADNMLLLQRSWGGWPKNINVARHFNETEIKEIQNEKNKKDATIDNGTTFTHLRFLAKMVKATSDDNYRNAFTKGFEYLIEAQYENGGWPQFYPLRKGYYSHITFNDDAMTGVLFLMKDIADRQPDFSFLTEEQIQKAQISLNKGIEVVLKTQIEIDGKLTGWCAQHDELTLLPDKARSYELASISGKETVTVLEFLMSLENPSDEIKQSIISACNWFIDSKISGYNLEYIPDSTASEGFNRFLVKDSTGPDLWARFYSIETGKPLWVDRNGIIRENHSDISPERRNNYSYVEQFAHELLIHEFPEWKKKNGIENSLPSVNDK